MKKQKKQLIISLLALVVLVGGYFGLQYYYQNAPQENTWVEPEYVLQLEVESVQHIAYNYEDEDYSFTKQGEEWIYDADTSVDIDEEYIDRMAMRCAEMEIINKIENVTDMSQFGLAEIGRYVTFKTSDAEYTYYVGDRNTVANGYYVCLPGEDTVYLVKNWMITAFNATLENVLVKEETTNS